jgi:hypothetical protein
MRYSAVDPSRAVVSILRRSKACEEANSFTKRCGNGLKKRADNSQKALAVIIDPDFFTDVQGSNPHILSSKSLKD